MKAKIIIYSLTALSLAAAVYFLVIKKQAPIGLSTGGVKAYSIVKKYTYEGTASSLLANRKGFVFASKTNDRILITQTDFDGKKIFTSREPVVNWDAETNDLSMATDPSGARLCVVWTELLGNNTKLYYKFHNFETDEPSEVVEIRELNPISHLNLIYNTIYDEFEIFYIAKNILKLVTIDSLGFNKPPVSLSFKITPDITKIIWNEYDNLYALVTPKRLVQFDINENLISDNSFVIDNITKPSNICIFYNQINNVYNIFVSQRDKLQMVTMDNQANILNTMQVKLPDTSNVDFAVADNGQAYDVFYFSEIMKRIIHTTVSYEGGFSNKYYKLTDAEGKNLSVILSDGKLAILYTTAGENPESVLCIAVQGGWGAGKKSDITAFGGRYGAPATIDGDGGTGRRKIVSTGGRPVNVVDKTWEEIPVSPVRKKESTAKKNKRREKARRGSGVRR